MKARWIAHLNPNPQLPIIGQTLVASWWPGRYYFISTIAGDPSSPMSRLTHAIEHGGSSEDAKPPQTYITGVFRSSKDFIPKSSDPLYEREYADLESARSGHAEIVSLLEQGRLTFA
ncbi:MAG: hypothetical protein ACREA9_23325 [Pyrinomonadaceae bacterium]